MELVKTLILGTIACICMHSVTFFLFRYNPPEYLVKFKWIIFVLLFSVLFLIEDYNNLLNSENIKVLATINAFIAYSFISGLKK